MTERPLQPTRAQVERFWKQFGWYFSEDYWFSPISGELFVKELPPPDMSNLYKYAITKLKARNKWNIELSSPVCFPNHYLVKISDSLNPQHETYTGQSEDLASAVFWAIWEMIEEEGL